MPIGQAVAAIWRFIDFSKLRPSAILDLLYACFDYSRRVRRLSLCKIWGDSVEFNQNRWHQKTRI